MHLYETHLHTSTVSACANSTPLEQVNAYKQRGYTGVIVTDHFYTSYARHSGKSSWQGKIEFFASGFCEAKKAGSLLGLDVFFGWEYTAEGLDFLTYGLDESFLLKNPQLERGVTIKEYSRLVRDNGGYLAQAHPCREAYWIDNPRTADPKLIDGVEVLNTSDTDRANQKARKFAKANRLPIQAGSDSHSHCMGYAASGVILERKADSIHDIISEIRTFRVQLIEA